MALINSVLSWLMKQRIHQMELFMKYPHEVQLDWFTNLLSQAKNTEWGRTYDYKSITRPEEFKSRVPVSDYESIKPYIDRLRQGEQNILWPSEIKWFAKSSGTTNEKSKFIPVSEESLEECHYKGGKDLLSIYCNNHPETLLFDGKSIAMGGSHQVMEVSNDWSYNEGDLSAIIIQNLPFWAEFRRTPNLSIALMNEWESKIERMAAETINHNVTSASGVPSWTLLLFKRVLEMTGKSDILQVWPKFELFIHGGVNFIPYQEQFKKLLPSPKMTYLETYNASEGFFGIQDRDRADDMLLMLDYGIYYEFLPVDRLDSPGTATKTLDQVEMDVNYAMIISTNAGLWRYMIGDTVTFTTLSPYRIKITGRTKNFINAFGEEVIIDNAEKALAIACEKCKAVVSEYTAGPVYFNKEERGAHEWLIEFEQPPDDVGYFTVALDNALKSLNSDYEAKRYRDMILGEPIIRVMPAGTFYSWLKMKGKLGGQNKVPRLSNDRKYIGEILDILK
ncbi:MAG: GH3 auxin-responsive promoter family protein [Bacteroidetes bacterium]|nr:GH3 auxin-responsive promoter family protein [Bacteroidota bacterium]